MNEDREGWQGLIRGATAPKDGHKPSDSRALGG